MTDTNEVNNAVEQQEEQNVHIPMEQILAALLNKFGKVEIDLSDLMRNYSTFSVKVDQDPETKTLSFELVELEENDIEPESASE